MIGGAARLRSSPLSVRGRLSTQALSLASIAMLETSPTFILAGTLGQFLSTSKVGRLLHCAPAACGNAARLAADRLMANANARCFMALPPRCLMPTMRESCAWGNRAGAELYPLKSSLARGFRLNWLGQTCSGEKEPS